MSDGPARGAAARRAARAGASTARTRPSRDDARTPPSPPVSARSLDPDALAALEEERAFLLRSLADLEREHAAGDVDDADYAELKDGYTARAAEVIRAIDDRGVRAADAQRPRDWRRTAVVLVVVGAIAVAGGWFVFRDAGTRAPGQGLTGDARQDSANLIAQAQALTGQATAALQKGRSEEAVSLYSKALETYDRALQLSPANVQAMTYRAWVLHTVALNSDKAAASQLDAQAYAGLTEAIGVDPTYADARVFRAILERNAGRFTEASADLAAVDMKAIPPFMVNLVDSVKADVAAGRTG